MQTLPRYAGQGCAGTSAVLALRSGTESAPDPLDMGHEDRLSFHVFAHREAEFYTTLMHLWRQVTFHKGHQQELSRFC